MQLYDNNAGQWIDGPESWLDVFDHLSVTGPDGPASVEAETGLDKLSVEELKTLAADRDIDIAGVRKKDAIVAAIRDHIAANEPVGAQSGGGEPPSDA